MKNQILVPFFALGILFTSGCGPSPEAVCEHVIDLAKKEFGDAGGGIEVETCVKELKKEKEMQGAMKFKKQAKCVLKADSLEDVGKCDED